MQTSMWICGSGSKKLRPPNTIDKAHGKGRGRGEAFWQDLICAAIGCGLLQLTFSRICATGLYRPQIAATLVVTSKGAEIARGGGKWKVPCLLDSGPESTQSSKKRRKPGGSNLMPVIESLLSSHLKWYEITNTTQYQHPGVFASGEGSDTNIPRLGYIPDCSKLPHYTPNKPHFLYDENQLSKGHYNDNPREVVVNGEKRHVRIRYAACQGVQKCSFPSCIFVSSNRAKKCPKHPSAQLEATGSCPVYVVYIYPTNYHENHERWLAGITKDCLFNATANNLHNHPLPQANKVPSILVSTITAAVRCNPGLTPSQINIGSLL